MIFRIRQLAFCVAGLGAAYATGRVDMADGPPLMKQVDAWWLEQPKNADGKVDGRLLIAESRQRGYCVCPKPMRQMIDFTPEGNPGMSAPFTCKWCGQPETRQSWEFWYLEEKAEA